MLRIEQDVIALLLNQELVNWTMWQEARMFSASPYMQILILNELNLIIKYWSTDKI
jgi:hypothetical protein